MGNWPGHGEPEATQALVKQAGCRARCPDPPSQPCGSAWGGHPHTPVLQANNDILAFLSGMPVTRNTKYLDLKNSVSQNRPRRAPRPAPLSFCSKDLSKPSAAPWVPRSSPDSPSSQVAPPPPAFLLRTPPPLRVYKRTP